MGKALLVGGSSGTLASGDFCNCFGYTTDTSTEANSVASATEACTFSLLGFNVISGGSGTNNLQFRDTGGNGAQLATGASTGVKEDTVNSDVLSAADTFALAYTDTGSNSTISWTKENVQFASGHGSFHLAANFLGVVCDVASATQFGAIYGSIVADLSAVIADVSMKNRAYDTWAAMQVRVTANARTNDSVFKNNIAGSAGTGLITYTSGVTGLLTDLAIADAISAGQLLCMQLALLTGVQDLNVSFIGATLTSSTVKSETFAGLQAGIARAASATAHYLPPGGTISSLTAFTEAQARVKVGFAGTASNLRCYLSANTYTVDGTLKLFKNGSAVLTTTITNLGGAAWYENSADTVDFVATDELSFEFVDGTTGSITIQNVGVTLLDTTTYDSLFAQICM